MSQLANLAVITEPGRQKEGDQGLKVILSYVSSLRRAYTTCDLVSDKEKLTLTRSMSILLALKRLRQGDCCEFEASLDCISEFKASLNSELESVRPSLKHTHTNKQRVTI